LQRGNPDLLPPPPQNRTFPSLLSFSPAHSGQSFPSSWNASSQYFSRRYFTFPVGPSLFGYQKIAWSFPLFFAAWKSSSKPSVPGRVKCGCCSLFLRVAFSLNSGPLRNTVLFGIAPMRYFSPRYPDFPSRGLMTSWRHPLSLGSKYVETFFFPRFISLSRLRRLPLLGLSSSCWKMFRREASSSSPPSFAFKGHPYFFFSPSVSWHGFFFGPFFHAGLKSRDEIFPMDRRTHEKRVRGDPSHSPPPLVLVSLGEGGRFHFPFLSTIFSFFLPMVALRRVCLRGFLFALAPLAVFYLFPSYRERDLAI